MRHRIYMSVAIAVSLLALLAVRPLENAQAAASTQTAAAKAAVVAVAVKQAAALPSPYRANNWSCVPTAQHPTPIILVHGTYGDEKSLFQYLSYYLVSAGYCVYALDYGNRGTGPIVASAGQLSTFVDGVLAATGAAKVSIVGHSQGGMMPRYYIKYLGGAAKVDDLVGIAPSNHGTTWAGLQKAVAGYTCTACVQQKAGSTFLAQLNAGDETPGVVSYTTIDSTHDTFLVPYTSGDLSGPNSTNVVIQKFCPKDVSDHLALPSDPPVIFEVLDALSVPGPAAASFVPRCTF